MQFDQYRQAIVDEEQLKILSVLYWISGGMTAFASFYFLVYAALGTVFLSDAFTTSSSAPPDFLGRFFILFGLALFLVVLAVAILKILVGFWLRKRTHRILSMVVAGLSCLEVPYGTALGVYTLVVLSRPSVKMLFDGAGAAPAVGWNVPPRPPAADNG